MLEQVKNQSLAVLWVGIGFAFLIILLIGMSEAHLVVLVLGGFCLVVTAIMVVFAVRAKRR
jgi:hypothetical protein